MSRGVNWNIEKYKDEHESEEQWLLRKAFMERWKDQYPEERLVCLARVFTNIEFMGCRYPAEVMNEVSKLSDEVAKSYRQSRKTKLQRTFVSASDAAEDRARGVKRKGGQIVDSSPLKAAHIPFVRQGHVFEEIKETVVISESDDDDVEIVSETKPPSAPEKTEFPLSQSFSKEEDNAYLQEMQAFKCLDVRLFRESMFKTPFGSLVLLMRPWMNKTCNIQASCSACRLLLTCNYEDGCYSTMINNVLVAEATGTTKTEARIIVETLAWQRLQKECISVVIKEQFIPQGDRITSDDVTGNKTVKLQDTSENFGIPVENSVAMKMMKMMGWSGGGLGADSQGIAEPIKPHFQLVKRAGLGATSLDLRAMRRSVTDLMRRYSQSECFDVDLVFAADFSKEERAELHQLARKTGLNSKSYGKDEDRFLVIRKKMNPFALVKAIVAKGGCTPKYQLFIPEALGKR